MKYAVVFLAFAVACVFAATQTASHSMQIGAFWCALAFGGVGVAYAFGGPRTFGKRSNGTLPLWSRALYAPYFLLNAGCLWGFRRSSRENDFDEIAPNMILGCRLNARDHATIERLNLKSVFDLASEFCEVATLRQLNYRSQPLLDSSHVADTNGRNGHNQNARRGQLSRDVVEHSVCRASRSKPKLCARIISDCRWKSRLSRAMSRSGRRKLGE